MSLPSPSGHSYQTVMQGTQLSREAAKAALREARGKFYVYVLTRPCGTPFYVGKGFGDRVFCHERDAVNTTLRSHKLNTIRALHGAGLTVSYTVEVLPTEVAALERERELILTYGRHDLGTGPLTNMTDGGEGPANFSDETRQRHRDTLAGVLEDGSPRSAVNAFFNRTGVKVGSVPIKPLGERRLEPLTPHPNPRQPSARQAAALAAVVIGNSAILRPGCLLRRVFDLEDGPAVLENGVGRDMLRSGMIEIAEAIPGAEVLEVTDIGYRATLGFVGETVLLDYGAIMPEA